MTKLSFIIIKKKKKIEMEIYTNIKLAYMGLVLKRKSSKLRRAQIEESLH